MDTQAFAGLFFIIFLSLLLIHQRKRLHVQGLFPALYFVMYRTSLGLDAMDYLGGKGRKFFKVLSPVIIGMGFLGMALITVELLRGLYATVMQPQAAAGVGIVQPFWEGVPGTVFVPFFYFIISIFIIATIHEFSHGVLARVWNIKVKSSGFAFLGIGLPVIPAAFVEPEEKQLQKRPLKQQLAVFAAGPVSNIVLAFVILLFMGSLMPPIAEAMFTPNGVEVTSFIDGNVTYPAENSELQIGDIILKVNEHDIKDYQSFNETLHLYAPNETVNITTANAVHPITLTRHEDRENGFLGVNVKAHLEDKPEFVARYGALVPAFTRWFTGLLYWLFVLNLGIGLFNLVPIGPIDGGRMLLAALQYFYSEQKAKAIWSHTSTFLLACLILNIVLSIVL